MGLGSLVATVISINGCVCSDTIDLPDAAIIDAGIDAGSVGGGAGGGGQDAGLPLKLACTVLNAKRCEYLQRCGLIAASNSAMRDCLALQQATSCGPTKWQPRAEAPVLTLRYDPRLAQVCADGWATRECTDFGTEPIACGMRFLFPNAFNAQACYDGYKECTDFLGAERVCRGAACPRICRPVGMVGEVCSDNPDCTNGLYCRVNLTGGGSCTAYGQLAQACDAAQPCGLGLVCNAGRCVQPPMANQPCLGAWCDDNAWCLNSADGGQCKPRQGAGAACTDDAQCASLLLCEVLTGQCVSRTITTLGAECGLRQACPLGSVCLNATATSLGTCQPPLEVGASCKSSNDCLAHLACIGLDGGLALGCGARQPDGMRCGENRDCQLLSICRQQLCMRLPTNGEDCRQTQRCLFGPCLATDAGSICTEPYGPGVVCTKNADCGSNRCVTGKCLPGCVP